MEAVTKLCHSDAAQVEPWHVPKTPGLNDPPRSRSFGKRWFHWPAGPGTTWRCASSHAPLHCPRPTLVGLDEAPLIGINGRERSVKRQRGRSA